MVLQAARVRGGVTLDLAWKDGKATKATLMVDAHAPSRSMEVVYEKKTVASFTTKGGLVKKLHF
jgi:alpha-L-fucosidase 2